jgi:hypothetical protein
VFIVSLGGIGTRSLRLILRLLRKGCENRDCLYQSFGIDTNISEPNARLNTPRAIPFNLHRCKHHKSHAIEASGSMSCSMKGVSRENTSPYAGCFCFLRQPTRLNHPYLCAHGQPLRLWLFTSLRPCSAETLFSLHRLFIFEGAPFAGNLKLRQLQVTTIRGALSYIS